MKTNSTAIRFPGFTMIELLAAMAITSVIMVTLLAFVSQSTTSYNQTQRAVSTVSEARAFIQFFDRELSTRLPGTPLIHEGKPGADPSESARIAFVRVVSSDEFDKNNPGDLRTSVYYVDFSSDGSSDVSPKLFRKILGASETQSLIESGQAPAFPNIDPELDESIVPNVLSFEAAPMFRDPVSGELVKCELVSPQAPVLIKFSITFVDDSSAQLFKTKSEWIRLATSPRETERQLIRTFTRSIPIAK